jgi:hypothetical protein
VADLPAIAKPLATGNAFPDALPVMFPRRPSRRVGNTKRRAASRGLRSDTDDDSHDTAGRDDEACRWASRRVSSRIAELNAAG